MQTTAGQTSAMTPSTSADQLSTAKANASISSTSSSASVQSSASVVSSPTENTTMSPINPQATSNVPVAESKCKNNRVLTTPFRLTSRLLSTDYHLESKPIAIVCSTAVSTWRRRLHQLIPSSAMHNLTHHHHPMDHHQLLIPTMRGNTYPATAISSNHRCRAVHSSTHPRLWHLSTTNHRLHGCSTSADLGGLDLRADHSVLHHPKPHALRHIDDCPWTEPRPPAQSRHLLRRSRCSHIRS